MSVFLVVALAWFLGGIVVGVAGFGAMLVAIPLLMLCLPAREAVLVCCLLSPPRTTQVAWLYRKSTRWHDVFWLAAGCVPGCALGALTLLVVPMRFLQIAISLLLLFCVVMELLRGRSTWKLAESKLLLFVTGIACGFANAAVSMTGVPLILLALLQQWDKDRARGTMTAFFFLSSLVTLASQGLAGLYTMHLFWLACVGLAASLIGQYLGFWLGKRLNQVLFVRVVLVFLTVSAIGLFLKAL